MIGNTVSTPCSPRLATVIVGSDNSELRKLPARARLTRSRNFCINSSSGSFRRRQETVGNLDILVTCDDSSKVMDRLAACDGIAEVLARGETKMSVRLKTGLQIDLREVPEESYGAALQYFSGSKVHYILLRRTARERGLKLNEYGVYRGERRVAGRTEEEVYAAVGLPLIPPELRKARGEIEQARRGRLPRLLELQDLRGDLHTHTKATDGRASLLRPHPLAGCGAEIKEEHGTPARPSGSLFVYRNARNAPIRTARRSRAAAVNRPFPDPGEVGNS